MHQFKRSHAFTLIEMMVSIGIVAILVAILVPMLARVFDRSREVGSQVNLRSIGQVIDVYMRDARDLYPAPIEGRFYPWPYEGVDLRVTLSHWEVADQWHLLFLDNYPWDSHTKLYLAPGAVRDTSIQPSISTIFPSYRYSSSFLGQPRIWSGESIEDTAWSELVRGVKRSMVRYPSGKVLMWDVELPTIRRQLELDYFGNLNEQSPMLFADGHVDTRVPADANDGVTNWAPSAPYPHQFLHNTRDGVFGRDY